MADMKYFSGTEQGKGLQMMDNAIFAAKFPGIVGKRADSFTKWVTFNAAGEAMPVTRKIEFKKNPSLHKCDARCRNAKGCQCECSCGGKFHGAGN